MNVRNLSSLLLSLLTMIVLGCGGGGSDTPAVPDAPPASLTLTSSATQPLINTPVTITANVLNAAGSAVPSGTVVVFSTTGGDLSAVTATNANGDATAVLTGTVAGDITVTATVGSLPAKTVTVTITQDPNAPLSVALTTSASQANINTSVTLTATVTPVGPNGVIANGTVVTFTSTDGSFTASAPTANGVATATLTRTTPQTVSVKAAAGNITSSEINVTFIDPAAPTAITVADTSGVHFAGNSVIITANVVSTSGGTVPAGTPVTFAVTSGTGTLSSTTATTDANGNASVTLSSTVEGNVTVTVTAAQATGSHPIVFADPDKPASINLVTNRISGVINNLGAVTLTATLTPQNSVSGSIVDGTPVTFSILTGADGTLSSATAITSGGVASVTLNSSVVGNISVNATAGNSPAVTSNTVFVPFVNPTTVTVKVRTTGTLPLNTTIGGIEATVSASPSTGLSIATDPNGVSSDVSATGAGAGSTLITNSNNVAAIKLALINTGGIQTGEFATLNYHVAAGSFPTANDFSITLNRPVIDTLSTNVSGIGVALSVTIQ